MSLLRRTLDGIRFIRRREKKQSRLVLIATFVRIALTEALIVRLLRRRPTSARLYGFRVHFLDYGLYRGMFDELFVHKTYFFESERPDPLVLDCGSNIGLSVLFFKWLYPGARIVAFEPDPVSFAALERNVEENRLEGVVLHSAAVGASDAEVPFYYDPERPGLVTMSTNPNRLMGVSRMVKSVSLSRVIDDREVDFLKLDVEGAELEVLEDLAKSGKLALIRQMVIECHHHIDPERDELSAILRPLEAAGFGYQLAADYERRPLKSRRFQDVLLYAYRK